MFVWPQRSTRQSCLLKCSERNPFLHTKLKPILHTKRDRMLQAYHDILNGDNDLAKMAAAKAWSLWEARCATLRPSPQVIERFIEPHMAVSLAQIEVHYFVNKGFMEADQILSSMDTIKDIPGVIIHGRYDSVCPLDNAFSLAQNWLNSDLHIIRDAGHSSSEPSITDALVRSTDEAVRILSKRPVDNIT